MTDYKIYPFRQAVTDSRPYYLDYTAVREEWDWNPTDDMLANLTEKLA